jgi:hypothetical protein
LNCLILTAVCFRSGIVVSLIGAVFICLLPCICCIIGQIAQDAEKKKQIKQAVIGNIVKAKFDHNDAAFKNDECAICLDKFTDDCEVTPLPCNVKHYFHPDCIEDWFKQ